MAKDEPLCEELREENNRLIKRLREAKELQQTSIAEVERLRAEKKQLIERRVRKTRSSLPNRVTYPLCVGSIHERDQQRGSGYPTNTWKNRAVAGACQTCYLDYGQSSIGG